MFTSVVGLFDPGAGKHIKTELKQRLILNGQTIYLTRCLGKPQKNNGIFLVARPLRPYLVATKMEDNHLEASSVRLFSVIFDTQHFHGCSIVFILWFISLTQNSPIWNRIWLSFCSFYCLICQKFVILWIHFGVFLEYLPFFLNGKKDLDVYFLSSIIACYNPDRFLGHQTAGSQRYWH